MDTYRLDILDDDGRLTFTSQHRSIEDCARAMRGIVEDVCVRIGEDRSDIIWEGDPELWDGDEDGLIAELKAAVAERTRLNALNA